MATSLSEALGAAGGAAIRQWVRLTGRRVRQRDAPWLDCPMGPPGRIGPEFYGRLAERERLHIRPAPDAGLLPDFAALRGGRFDPAAVRPEVCDFYEHTSRYALEAWSEAPVPTRLFLWACSAARVMVGGSPSRSKASGHRLASSDARKPLTQAME